MYIVTRELWALVHRRMLAILGRRQIASQVRTAGDETASERTSSRRRASSFFLRSRPANDRTSLRTSFVLPCECHHQARKFPRGVRGLLDTHEVDLGEQIPELDLHILDHPTDVGDVARLALKRLAVELRLGGESTHIHQFRLVSSKGKRNRRSTHLPGKAPRKLDFSALPVDRSVPRGQEKHDGRGELVRCRPAALGGLKDVDRVPRSARWGGEF